MKASNAAPASDEVEVTLLGRGVGESCVIHLGHGRWMIVDSYREPDKRYKPPRPAARVYLDALGVSPDQVEHVVVTHLHTDHYLETDRLLDYYSDATMWVPAAFSQEKFQSLLGDESQAGEDDDNGVLTPLARAVVNAANRNTATFTGLDFLASGKILINEPGIMVQSLAPTPAAVTTANLGLAKALATKDIAQVKTFLRDDNQTSACIHVVVGDAVALLCGDVINEPAAHGWEAIINQSRHSTLDKAALVKVAHHGSVGAHHPEMWRDRTTTDVNMVVAPYWTQKLPRKEGIDLHLGISSNLFQAAPSSGSTTHIGGATLQLKARTGVIQARHSTANGWTIGLGGPAFKVK